MEKIVSYTAPLMPKDKPRYVMGVGNPEDLLMLWSHGVDMSDCIIPTKFARGGTLFTRRGKIRIRHRNYRRDFFDANEILGQILATAHNIAFYKKLAEDAREAILQNRFNEFKREFFASYLKDGDDGEE